MAGRPAPSTSNGLARYYATSGTPPGVFLGAGLANLDGGDGVAAGSEVTEAHLDAMLAASADRVSGRSVAGARSVPGNAVLNVLICIHGDGRQRLLGSSHGISCLTGIVDERPSVGQLADHLPLDLERVVHAFDLSDQFLDLRVDFNASHLGCFTSHDP